MTDNKPELYELSALLQRQGEIVESLADSAKAGLSGPDPSKRIAYLANGLEVSIKASHLLVGIVANSMRMTSGLSSILLKSGVIDHPTFVAALTDYETIGTESVEVLSQLKDTLASLRDLNDLATKVTDLNDELAGE